jgi:hypothetical protein
MSERHNLPSGGWVEFKDRSEIRERDRRPVRLQILKLTPDTRARLDSQQDVTDMSDDDMAIMLGLNDLCIVGIVAAASFLADGETLTVDRLLDLPGPDYDALQALSAPYVGALMGVAFDEPTPGDRNSPT